MEVIVRCFYSAILSVLFVCLNCSINMVMMMMMEISWATSGLSGVVCRGYVHSVRLCGFSAIHC